MPHFLTQVRVQGVRGIKDLEVGFISPVDFLPGTLFADYRPRQGAYKDARTPATIEFEYSTPDGGRAMRWRRTSGWRQTFYGRRNASQPQRPVHMHLMRNLDDPSEARDLVAGMTHGRAATQARPLTMWQMNFAERMLPFRYSEVVDLVRDGSSLLFARQIGGAEYSEFHMAAGERAMSRLSQEVADLHDALVLIDDVEARLHPWAQQLLMLHLQQLVLFNNLQFIVTTHSPVVLESVHPLARVFLERDVRGRVAAVALYQDVVQDALYGRARNALSLLCENEAAEAILHGVFDVLFLRLRIRRESVRIGRDTGASEFPAHAAAFSKFGQIDNFVFVLDGDQRDRGIKAKIAERVGRNVAVLFLPGEDAPEVWVWRILRSWTEPIAEQLNIDAAELSDRMDRQDAVFDLASEGPAAIAKIKLENLAHPLGWDVPDLCQVVARVEAGRTGCECQTLMRDLAQALTKWREDYV